MIGAAIAREVLDQRRPGIASLGDHREVGEPAGTTITGDPRRDHPPRDRRRHRQAVQRQGVDRQPRPPGPAREATSSPHRVHVTAHDRASNAGVVDSAPGPALRRDGRGELGTRAAPRHRARCAARTRIKIAPRRRATGAPTGTVQLRSRTVRLPALQQRFGVRLDRLETDLLQPNRRRAAARPPRTPRTTRAAGTTRRARRHRRPTVRPGRRSNSSFESIASTSPRPIRRVAQATRDDGRRTGKPQPLRTRYAWVCNATYGASGSPSGHTASTSASTKRSAPTATRGGPAEPAIVDLVPHEPRPRHPRSRPRPTHARSPKTGPYAKYHDSGSWRVAPTPESPNTVSRWERSTGCWLELLAPFDGRWGSPSSELRARNRQHPRSHECWSSHREPDPHTHR